MAIDNRIIRVTLDLGEFQATYQHVAITFSGAKYSSLKQGSAEITIANLNSDEINTIIRLSSPLVNPGQVKTLTVEVGRESYGASLEYFGNINFAIVSQPPDNIVTIFCLTGNSFKTKLLSRNNTQTTLSTLAQEIAADLGLSLNYQVTQEFIIKNYYFSGDAYTELKHLEETVRLRDITVSVNNKQLVITEKNHELNHFDLSVETGLIGTPQVDYNGGVLTMLYMPDISPLTVLDLKSDQYPFTNGPYQINFMNYVIANREQPFYIIARCAILRN